MKLFSALFVVIFLSVSVQTSSSHADPKECSESLKTLIEDNAYLKNPPAATNFRSWKDYQENLAIRWNDFFLAKTVIDIGSGQGIAVRDALEGGTFTRAIAIDFSDHSNAKHWDYVSDKTKSKIRFEEDSAEAALLRHPNTADVIVDNYGAFTYSPARIHILNSAFRALKPGGIAYFRCPPVSFVKVGVEMIPLEAYLSRKYPKIFSVRKNRTVPFENPDLDPFISADTVLVMRRPRGFQPIDLPLEIRSHRKWFFPGHSKIEFPFLVFDEKH
ncbi:MAG: class I SAM-dependent methyltransferase [Bdellovibrionales bacterium]|nr:class I SAM-dependent methyltransferase [Bdellovibrionales bacterium]